MLTWLIFVDLVTYLFELYNHYNYDCHSKEVVIGLAMRPVQWL